MNKKELDLDKALVEISIILKGFRQEINVFTTAYEATEFVDWLNNNHALSSHKVEDREKFTNKYFIFNDYRRKETVCINKNEIKAFEILFFMETNSEEMKDNFKMLKLEK